jgi:opacity protein-like surface antigen
MRKRYKLILLLLLLPCRFLMAQVNDAQAWLNLNVGKRITPRITAEVAGEVRLNENYSEVGTMLADLGLNYRFNDRFRAGLTYRFSMKRRLDDTYETRNTWYAEGSYREKLKPLEIVFRLRYQARYDEAGTSAEASTPTNHLRARLALRADLNRDYKPYLFGELFFRTSTSPYQPMDEYRVGGGIEYAFNRRHSLDLKYFISRETGVNNPETAYVIGVGYYILF